MMALYRLLIAVLWILVPLGLSAQQSGPNKDEMAGLAVSMSSKVFSGRPGATLSGSVDIVTVRTQKASKFNIEVNDLGQNPSGAVRSVPRGTGTRSCAAWIRIAKQEEIPAGGGTKRVPLSIDIPSDANGSYYAFINVQLVADRSGVGGTAVFIEPVLSVRVELDVMGPGKITMTATDVAFQYDIGDGRSGLLLTVKNEGNVKTTFEGDILIYSGGRRYPIRAEIPMDRDGNPPLVYPGMTRTVACDVSRMPSPGTYSAEVRLLLGRKWRSKSTFEVSVPERGALSFKPARAVSKKEFDIDVSVEPRYLEVTLPPGASRLHTIHIKNRDTVSISAKAVVVGVVHELNGFMTFTDLPDTAEKWIEVTPAEFMIRPRSETALRLNVKSPSFGDKSSVSAAVRILGDAGKDATNWISEADLGVPVIAVPAAAPPAKLNIVHLRVIRDNPDVNPTAAVLSVRNVGGRTAELLGKLTLERAKTGVAVQTVSLSEADGLILSPGVTREFRIPLPILDKDEFRLRVELSAANEPSAAVNDKVTFTCTKGAN